MTTNPTPTAQAAEQPAPIAVERLREVLAGLRIYESRMDESLYTRSVEVLCDTEAGHPGKWLLEGEDHLLVDYGMAMGVRVALRTIGAELLGESGDFNQLSRLLADQEEFLAEARARYEEFMSEMAED